MTRKQFDTFRLLIIFPQHEVTVCQDHSQLLFHDQSCNKIIPSTIDLDAPDPSEHSNTTGDSNDHKDQSKVFKKLQAGFQMSNTQWSYQKEAFNFEVTSRRFNSWTCISPMCYSNARILKTRWRAPKPTYRSLQILQHQKVQLRTRLDHHQPNPSK